MPYNSANSDTESVISVRRFVIRRTEIAHDGRCNILETHDSKERADHALQVLNEHEERNGRGKQYWTLEDTESTNYFKLLGYTSTRP